MHNQQKNFCQFVKESYPEFFCDKWVVDCGSLDVNGNNRYLFENCFYLGIDVVQGKNVDVICPIHLLPFAGQLFDVVLSTNALEHDMYWDQSLPKMCRLLKSEGLLFFSCSRGHPEHGTSATSPDLSGTSQIEEWANYYRNLDEGDIRSAIDIEDIFKEFEFRVTRDGRDLFFRGIKR